MSAVAITLTSVAFVLITGTSIWFCAGSSDEDYAKLSRERWVQEEYAEWTKSYDYEKGVSINEFEDKHLKDWRKRNEQKYIAHLVKEQKSVREN